MATPPTFNAGTEPSAAQWKTFLPISAIKGVDQTVNNSATLVNDSALFVTVAANAVYRFEMEIRYTTNTTANLKMAWTFPAGLGIHHDIICMASGTTVLNIFPWDQGSAFAVSGNTTAVRKGGVITVGGLGGTLQFQWAQNTANVSNTTVQASSYLLLNQIA